MSVGTVSEMWQLRAACRGPRSTVFFPPTSGERRDERDAREARAKVICGECGVRTECLDYALSSNDGGPIVPRLQVAPPMSQTADIVTDAPHPMLRQAGLASDVVHSPPSRPLAASPVLRI